MKRYSVVITSSAEADIINSFLWGCDKWGVSEAEEWARSIRISILESLSTFPMKYPVAPDRDESGREFRHMFVGRYRIIFHVELQVVRVIHVRGSFAEKEHQ